jgi:molybdate transport system substrate-binding protein
MRVQAAIIMAAMAALGAGAGTTKAGEVKFLSSNAVKTVVEELAPQFEKATEHKLKITFGATAPLKAQIDKGEPFDVTALTNSAIDALISEGKVTAATRADLARSGIGLAVKKGAAKPDISTTEAFKRTLLAASSIGYVEQGASGVYLKALFERLGIAEQLKPKLKFLPPSNPAAHAVANGETEIGMTQISEILPYAGAELVGPLPADIQLTTVFSAGVATAAKEPAGAQALITFLKAPAAAAVFKAKGLDPS